MRHGLIAPVLTTALLAAACTSTSQASAPLTGPTTCTASQLEMRLIFIGYATGNVEGIVDVRNKSSRDCDLSGYPALQLLDAAGNPLPTRTSNTTTSFFRAGPAPFVGVTLSAGSDPITVGRAIAGHAYIEMTWGDGTPPCEQPSSFAITPPGATGRVVISATPPTAGAPMPDICSGGAVSMLPIQQPKGEWVGPPPATPAPSPLAIPSPVVPFVRCLATDLSMGYFVLGAAAGSVRGMIEVRNDSSRECDLYGYAGLQFLDANRHPLPTHVTWTATNFWSDGPAAENVVGLTAGTPAIAGTQVAGHAYFPMWWSDVQPPCTSPAIIQVTPPDSDRSVFIASSGLPPDFCGNGSVWINPTQPASNG